MKSPCCHYSISIAACLCLLIAGFGGNANAQVPTKTITIHNDTTKATLYPVLAGYVGNVDLWLQAQFNVTDPNSQTFCNSFPDPGGVTPCSSTDRRVPALFRAYINLEHGVLPGQSVSITVPFYTQLAANINSNNLGTASAQYIDWWNAARVFFYDGATAITGAYNFNVDQNGKTVPPFPVNPVAGAAVPSCAAGNKFTCDPVKLVYYIGVYPTGSIPFQLGEYTFASAEGPPPGGLLKPGSPFSIDLRKTNFNISAVDGIYLPAAMEAILQDDPVKADSEYLGTTERVSEFRPHLEKFIEQNSAKPQWPYYWPSYFSLEDPTVAHDQPQDGDAPYALPSIPSANVVFAESYKVPAPAPPVLSSNTGDDDGLSPMLGSHAAEMVNLWNRCTSSSDIITPVCQKIRTVYDFFSRDYNDTCGFSGSPSAATMLTEVYGWAQFAGCSPPLVSTPGYDTAIVDYCGLQYNYLVNPQLRDRFNPYTHLIHETLKSNAYAFSIDDKAAFKSVPSTGSSTSTGLIITIGGAKGLIYDKQAPLPDARTYEKYCH